MYISEIELKNFRNYNKANINFSNNMNIIYGENAQGKTNILEAIFIAACGRSHRTSKDNELIKKDSNEFKIKIKALKKNYVSEIEINYKKEDRKKVAINGISLLKIGELMGNLYAVMFSPEDLLIIKEGPSERRRFIDITLSIIKPSYFYDMQEYARIMKQKNLLLKKIDQSPSLIGTLDVWNEQLAVSGARIIMARRTFIERLSKISSMKHNRMSEKKEKLEINYRSSIKLKDLENEMEIKQAFIDELDGIREVELFRKTSLKGPHRDDYEIMLNDENIKMYGSQGQQRTAILSIKLAEIDIMKMDCDDQPILLLDDVMSELDKERKHHLIDNIKDVQTFITTTEKEIFENIIQEKVNIIEIKNGNIYYDN